MIKLDIKPGIEQMADCKVFLNVGASMDIPGGKFVTGKYGESILNGGMGGLTGIVGPGNNFKSTIQWFMFLTSMARYCSSAFGSYRGQVYDTEINVNPERVQHLAEQIEEFKGHDPYTNEDVILTDATNHLGDEWYDKYREFLSDKRKVVDKILVTTPFLDKDKTNCINIPLPTFTSVDSFSEFVTADVVKMQEENSLGESGANTVSMRQGLQKNRFLMEVPKLAGRVSDYVFLSAHVGDTFEMDPRKPQRKKLSYLPMGQKLKGVPEKFTFLMNNCWYCSGSHPMFNQSTKAPEYPRNQNDDMKGSTDLTEVTIVNLRNKNGQTGIPSQLIVSQTDGVLATLTEFNLVKETGRFGLVGNLQNYAMALMPEVKLSRTTVRRKIDTDPKLRRAINITSEICQMQELWPWLEMAYAVDMVTVYEGIKDLGYDWDLLLTTRGWWTFDNDKQDVPFLSSMDILKMRVGEYIPYWMKEPPKKALELYEKVNGVKWSPAK